MHSSSIVLSVDASRVTPDCLAPVVRELEQVRVMKPGTSLITLLVPAGYDVATLTSFLKTEAAVSINIKSRV